ncbi:tetratricopeptide repeat protein [Terasakiella pusilla]|uniref:tetratricopeptide repeat protein n=1 Tax=Terasakiella pusilla TaxID=64973 RepID=UPI003AA95380
MDVLHKNQTALPPFEEATDACWRDLTQNANLLFKQGNYKQARTFYQCALKEAEDIFTSAQMGADYTDTDPASLLIASSTNLVQNLTKLEDHSQAYQVLSGIVHRLCRTLLDDVSSYRLKRKCAQHLQYVTRYLVKVMQSGGSPQETIAKEVQFAKDCFIKFSSPTTTYYQTARSVA